ncbi:MAG: EXLDI protein [Chloroflexota bacterium]|mgnify:CR=1 FL=1
MPNKTIYVSENDIALFEEAKSIAGEALSSVIARALREYVARHRERERGMAEVSVRVGSGGSEREQRFIGSQIGKWAGVSDDKEWWLEAKIYLTQKGNWAVYLVQVCKASLLTDPKEWKRSGDYLVNARRADLLVAREPKELEGKLPEALRAMLEELAERNERPVEYLDI